jgi:hypothetical protein
VNTGIKAPPARWGAGFSTGKASDRIDGAISSGIDRSKNRSIHDRRRT